MTSDALAIFIYAMTVFGFAYIVGQSVVSKVIRERMFSWGTRHASIIGFIVLTFVTMIECPACLGFHIGWIVGLIYGLGWYSLALGLFTTGTNLVLAKLTRLMD